MKLISQENHSLSVVYVATLVLHLRTTTQIDELIRHSSILIQQRWDFLGPSGGTFNNSEASNFSLFSQIDNALQWQPDDIGEYIRHAHFSLELTEDQAEILCAHNIMYEFTDSHTVHAYAPFGSIDGHILVVDLVWDSDTSRWVYFNTKALELVSLDDLHSRVLKTTRITFAIATAEEALADEFDGVDDIGQDGSDDDGDGNYWSRFPQPDKPATKAVKGDCNGGDGGKDDSDDDYWGQYDQEDQPDDNMNNLDAQDMDIETKTMDILPVLPDQPAVSLAVQNMAGQQAQLMVAESVRLSLAAAASAARAVGMPEAEFLKMSLAAFFSSGNNTEP
ncbi:hypothetical protein LPJ66_000586 [Kickxella alabastrina]|uniref:Uncharacterized protein n=1 Tax=Kickxella alabastrina TaxID=61397 RepID=A0ACC1IVM9_9FUNG|nr:hypothetical protein LPJ66_000586 [Kickxella alabastrina]